MNNNPNKQIQLLTQKIDDSILQSYKLWPTNYIAYDMLYNTNKFEKEYTIEEKQLFQRRLELRIDDNSTVLKEGFLAMYANPVVNKLKYKMQQSKSKILLIYTGGTIGMIKDYETGALKAFDFKKLLKRIPELQLLDCEIDTVSFEKPLDSSNIAIQDWQTIASIIEDKL